MERTALQAHARQSPRFRSRAPNQMSYHTPAPGSQQEACPTIAQDTPNTQVSATVPRATVQLFSLGRQKGQKRTREEFRLCVARPGSNPGSAPYEAREFGKFFNLLFNLRSPREVRETQREGEPRGRQPVCGDLRSQVVPETRGPRIHHLAPLS